MVLEGEDGTAETCGVLRLIIPLVPCVHSASLLAVHPVNCTFEWLEISAGRSSFTQKDRCDVKETERNGNKKSIEDIKEAEEKFINFIAKYSR